jgi:acetolactate synthase-1/2/3 large subunit
MALAFGRLTGTVGVCIATSGPGVTNLVTGLATATSEGSAVLAIGGEVPLNDCVLTIGYDTIEPLRLIHEIRNVITHNTHVALDVGTHYIWTNRYCAADHARQFMVSNGQQTLGVAMPWAIAMSMLHPNDRVLSISGDGGFLFSVMELETAVREGVKFVHIIWNSNSYDMVAFQEQAAYGEESGVKLGGYDVVKLAESFGYKGYNITSASELAQVLAQAFGSDVPVIINVPVDYSRNHRLMQDVIQSYVN